MSEFDLKAFYRFCNALKIDTKEQGQVYLGKRLLGTQTMLVNEIAEGMERGIRDFVCLKARQLGISTMSLAFDLYWAFKYKGMMGALISHDEPSRNQFRNTLDMYYDGLPDDYKQRRLKNNIHGMLFANRSGLSFRVAGTRATGGGALGRSAAFPFVHATEMSSWGDPEGLKSLKASLAETNPLRFYLWESTARGFGNAFYDMWEEAKRAVTQKAIFITWWANQYYRAPRHSDIWKVYWGYKGRLTGDERDWVKEIKSLYKVEIDDGQMAWWRWKMTESIGDEQTMMQEFPPTEFHAFVATGSQFFTTHSLTDAYKKERGYAKGQQYRVQVGTQFSSTTLLATTPKLTTLNVWEQPQPKGTYVLGADPAYGSSEWADRFCISVWRCYADRIVQVAEFVDPNMATYSFAWVIAYLAGAYEPCLVNLEINGPGQGVLNELQNMKRALVSGSMDEVTKKEARTIMTVSKNISSYLYRRMDTFSGPGAIHTLMGHDMKERMMNTLRDYFERGMVIVRSRSLLDEMKSIEREAGNAPQAHGRAKDDRVVAAALACLAWNDQRRTSLITQNAMYDLVTDAEKGGASGVVDKMVADYLKKIGMKRPPRPGMRM